MGRFNLANLKKATYYLQRNGLKKTWYAVWERLEEGKQPSYNYVPVSEEELARQRREVAAVGQENVQQHADGQESEQQFTGGQEPKRSFTTTFSILVPAYRTKEIYLRELIDSLLNQSYPKWELIIADATPETSVEEIVRTYTDARIRYVRLQENAGIAENTNQALPHATGDYVGLLDHDDLLTPDALFEMTRAIEKAKGTGLELQMLYSDEDKCNGDCTRYYEPHFKEDFNLDLLLSNNYICHFLVMKRELIQELGFRSEYDGAQDFDLVLRAAAKLKDSEKLIVHIPKVLYHWRCHTGSTAENPQSKLYAYEAGKRAVQDFADNAGWTATAENTSHVGFYKLQYQCDIFAIRPDVGAIGGPLISKGKIVGGRMDAAGNVIYQGLPVHYSGYMHRAAMNQNAACLDIRNIKVRPECQALLDKMMDDMQTDTGEFRMKNEEAQKSSLEFCRQLREAGYRILYLPEMSRKV